MLMGKILTGDYDEDLERIIDLCMQRKKTLRQVGAAQMRYTLKPGDVVRVKDIRPRRLIGLLAKVEGIRKTRASVRFVDGAASGYYHPVTVPLTCIEKAEGVPA